MVTVPLVVALHTSPSLSARASRQQHMEHVTIGVNPHKSATIEIVDHHENLLGSSRFTTDRAGYAAMRTYAGSWPDRVCAVEGNNGAGRWRNDSSRPASTSSMSRPSSPPGSGYSTPVTTARPPATPTRSRSSRSEALFWFR